MKRRQPIRTARTLLQSWVLALFAAFMALSGCKIGADLSALPTYTEDFQRTYFEAQNHCLKGDLDLAYTGFLSCLELEPEETALRFDLAKIDLHRERF